MNIARAAFALALLTLAACGDDDSAAPTPPVAAADAGAADATTGTSGGPADASTPPPDAAAPSGASVFTIDGTPSTSQDKISVSTFTDDRVVLNFGVQVLAAPTDYTFLLTYRLDKAKTASGSYGMEAVKSVEGLLRDANTAATYATTWEPAKTAGVTVELAVADGTITARWLGPVAGATTKTVEARVTSLPSTKK